MRKSALYVVAVLALVGVATLLVIDRTPRLSDDTPAPPAAIEVEGPPPPKDFAEKFAAERGESLMREAREQALDSARAEERERWENLRREQLLAARKAATTLPLTQTELTEQRAQRFDSEAVDRDWAPRAEAEVLEKLSQTGVNALDLRVECRTTVCRLQLVQRASEKPTSVPIRLALLTLTELQPSRARQAEGPAGTRITVSYLARR